MASAVLLKEAILSQDIANGLEFRSAIPGERSVEEAESGTRGYAQSMLQLKDVVALESWEETQKVLSSNLKLDLYASCNSKQTWEGEESAEYTNLISSTMQLKYC